MWGVAAVIHCTGLFGYDFSDAASSNLRRRCVLGKNETRLISTMLVLVGILLIILCAIALATIPRFVDNRMLATILELVFLAALIGIFLWLR
jgi:hypothetical protein